MRGNILRVDPGIERAQVETALLSQKRHLEKRLLAAHGDTHRELLQYRDAVKTLLERLNEQ